MKASEGLQFDNNLVESPMCSLFPLTFLRNNKLNAFDGIL